MLGVMGDCHYLHLAFTIVDLYHYDMEALNQLSSHSMMII